MIKIIAGRLKGRNIQTLKGNRYRPSKSKFKEALFSILSSGDFLGKGILNDATVLDLFSGTGNLSFEALSRGAAHCTMIDFDAEHLGLAQITAEQFGELDKLSFLRLDATNLPSATRKYNLVFIDPPYHKGLVEKSLKSIALKGWLAIGAIIAVETSRKEDLKFIEQYELLQERIYGNSKLIMLSYTREAK